MRIALGTLAAVAVTLLLTGLGSALSRQLGGGWVPMTLAVPVVVWLAVEAALLEGAVAAAAVGVVMDASAGGPAGLLTFLAVVLFVVVRAGAAALGARDVLGVAVMSMAGGLLVGFLALLLLRLVSAPGTEPGWGLMGRVALDALTAAAASPAVAWVLDRVGTASRAREPGLPG